MKPSPGIKSRGGDGCHCRESPELLTWLDHFSAGGKASPASLLRLQSCPTGPRIKGTPPRCSRIRGRKQNTPQNGFLTVQTWQLPLPPELHPNFPNAIPLIREHNQGHERAEACGRKRTPQPQGFKTYRWRADTGEESSNQPGQTLERWVLEQWWGSADYWVSLQV